MDNPDNTIVTGRQSSAEATGSLLAAIEKMGSNMSASMEAMASKIEQLASKPPPTESGKQRKPAGTELPTKGKKPRGAESSSKGKGRLVESRDTELSGEDTSDSEEDHWADRQGDVRDMQTPVFYDSDDEVSLEVSEDTSKLLSKSFTTTLPNAERRRVKQDFPVPRVNVTKCPKLDPIFKAPGAALKGEAKSAESELGRIQAFMLDPVGPLVQTLEGIRAGTLTYEDADHAISSAISLLGNASSHISKLRRKKVLKELNPDILDLVEEDSHFTKAAPNLFGSGFEKTMKERAEAMKLLKGAKKTEGARKPFFRSTRPPRPHRGGGYFSRGVVRRGRYQPYPRRGSGRGDYHHREKSYAEK